MASRTAQARYVSRAEAGCIDFDAALEAYLDGGSYEELLQAAGKVIDCNLPIAPEHADTISTATPRARSGAGSP